MVSVALAVIMLFGSRAMNLDDKVCYCFHVPRRKLVNWVRLNAPKVPSQLSQCGGAGTGCGWCVPFLQQIFRQGTEKPNASEKSQSSRSIDEMSAEEYAALRAAYVNSGKGKPPPGAEPLPSVVEEKKEIEDE